MRDIDLKSLVLHIRIEGSKTRREYDVPIPDGLQPWLERLTEKTEKSGFLPDDQAFNVSRFKPRNLVRRDELGEYQVVACFRELSRRLGFPVSSHRFRHTLGSALANKPNANIYLIKEIFGHTSIKTTLEYVEADLTAMRAVLNDRQ